MRIKFALQRILSPLFKFLGPWYVRRLQANYTFNGRLLSKMLPYSFASCGINFRANGIPLIHDPQLITIGDNFTINNGAQICPRGKVYIGNNVTMSRGSQITAGEFDTTYWREQRLAGNVPHMEKDVFIGDGTWLCVNSVVLPGVKITGRGVIVAAGAVVSKDIAEDFVIVGGIPAKIIKKIVK